jgi:hypothetical protein
VTGIIIIIIHPFVVPWPLFQFLDPKRSVGLLGRGISPLQGLYVYRTTQTQNKRTQYKHSCFKWNLNPRSQR